MGKVRIPNGEHMNCPKFFWVISNAQILRRSEISAIYRRGIKSINNFDMLWVPHSDKTTLFSLDWSRRNQYVVVWDLTGLPVFLFYLVRKWRCCYKSWALELHHHYDSWNIIHRSQLQPNHRYDKRIITKISICLISSMPVMKGWTLFKLKSCFLLWFLSGMLGIVLGIEK